MTRADDKNIYEGIPRDISDIADNIRDVNDEFGSEDFGFDVALIRDPRPFFLMYELIRIAKEKGKEGALSELKVLWRKIMAVQLIESDYMFLSRETYERMLSDHFGR